MSGSSQQPEIHRLVAEAQVGESLVRRIMASFYGDVRKHHALGPVFISILGDGSWNAHIERIVRFWLTAFRIERVYDGREFMPAHTRHAAITPELAPHWLALFAQTLERECRPREAAAFMAIAEAMMENILIGLQKRDRGAKRGEPRSS